MVARAQVTIDSITERARLERFARSLTAEELARPARGTAWTVSDSIAHVATLDAAYKALPERRNEPEIVAWLSRPEVAAPISTYQKAMG